jgi:hypothetical protein
VSKRGYSLIAEDPASNILASQPHKRRRATTNKQQRGRQLPAVISEFKEVVKIPTTNFNASNKGFKFLRSETDGGDPAQEFAIAGPLKNFLQKLHQRSIQLTLLGQLTFLGAFLMN